MTGWLGVEHAANVRAIHLNMLPFLQTVATQGEEEEAWLRACSRQIKALGDYLRLQSRRPQSIAWAAADNPLGQASWIVERFHDWTDLDGRPLETVFSLDQLITNAMIYIMTDSFVSGAWYYHAMSLESRANTLRHPRCGVPTAYAAFPGDPLFPPPPRRLAEGVYDIERWTPMPRGGHFAALQEPELFARDVAEWARQAS